MAKRILVPIAQDEQTPTIVPLVAALARDAGATVRLLEVHPVPTAAFVEQARREPLYGYDPSVTQLLDHHAALFRRAREERIEAESLARLHELEVLMDGVAVERRVRFGKAVDEIAHEAHVFGADLIAVAEPRRPWWRLTLRRVADRLRARARVPVLTLSGAAR